MTTEKQVNRKGGEEGGGGGRREMGTNWKRGR